MNIDIIGIKFHSGYTAIPVDKNHYILNDNVTGYTRHHMNYRKYGYEDWGGIVNYFKEKEPGAVIKFIYRKPINKEVWL